MSNSIITIRLTVVAVFLLATTVTASLALGLHYYFGRSLAWQAASDLYTGASNNVASKWQHISEQNSNTVTLLAENRSLTDAKIEGKIMLSIAQLMERNPLFYGVYLGHADGRFYELINLNTGSKARRALRAVPDDRWLLVEIKGEGESRLRTYRYLDKDLNLRVERTEPTDFDPRERPWYVQAIKSKEVYQSQPYLFAQLNQPGRTLSIPVADSETVLGFDMTLETLSEFLGEQTVAEQGSLFVYTGDGNVIASSAPISGDKAPIPNIDIELSTQERDYIRSLGELTVSNELDWPPFDYALLGQPQGYSIDVIKLIAEALELPIRFINGLSWSELVQEFKEGELDILHSVLITADNKEWGLPSREYAFLPYSIVSAEKNNKIESLESMQDKRLAIPSGWSVIPVVRAAYPNIIIVEVPSTLAAMRKVLAGEVDGALDNKVILEYLQKHYYLEGLHFSDTINFGESDAPQTLHMFVSPDKAPLLDLIDRAIGAIGRDQRTVLRQYWLGEDLSVNAGGDSASVPDEVFLQAVTDESIHNELIPLTREGEKAFAFMAPLRRAAGEADGMYLGLMVPEAAVVGPFMERVVLAIVITSAALLLLIPLSWAFASPIVSPIKQLARENDKVRRRDYDSVSRIPTRIRELNELSDSMVTMVEAIKAHELAQRELMDAFIRLIAAAIDEKSPYTGGHCERVPQLAMMLARHASNAETGPFEGFSLDSEDQWREYRIAAWLHDCGKITTPEHIVDKGSKLETIYNRVHEIRMRFEVLWRDAQISYLETLKEHPEQQGELAAKLQRDHAQLQEEFAFIAECNVGGEFLDEDKQARLKAIAQRTWIRHFDNRIGLSPVEELRVEGVARVPTPASEKLLADKPEHIIERTRSTDYPPEYGINMDVPEHLYNQGELYNLGISRGTLTAEDRFKINEHMISTIKMLESLPFPEELANVPRWASTHHETMRGSGYPRKLPGEALSVPERIMAVADVFEALTAADRPYKKAKPVSVALDILSKMVDDKHIDRDCFELFVKEKVYLEYAQEFLDSNQIDDVDPSRYVANE